MQKKKIIIFLSALSLLSFLIYSNLPAGRQEVLAVGVLPTLNEGTYLTGQTFSVWPSWSVLGSALGQALPVDPINRLAPAGTCVSSTNKFCLSNANCSPAEGGVCVLHDQTTGWSTADRRFSFACNSDSYVYRYVVAPSSSSYTVRARFEDTGLSPVNMNSFVSDFISTTIFKVTTGTPGVCYFNEEISTIETGRCGDGKLNLQRGEQCDPPGRIEYETGCSGIRGQKILSVCSSSCQWTASSTPCNAFSKCGNGKKEVGETCDEGALNGRYNHCNLTCTGPSLLGICGNSTTEHAYEICDPGTPGLEKYSPHDKAQSCSWDCQNWGPYCGDKIVQSQHGETCDGSQTCTIGGRQGTKICNDNCQKEDDKGTLAWWTFEDLEKSAVLDGLIAKDVSVFATNHALCKKEVDCPKLISGKIGKALEFNSPDISKIFSLRAEPSSDFEVNESITVEAWVKPSDYEELYQRVVERGGAKDQTGFDLELNASSTKHIARFNVWNNFPVGVDSESAISLNAWTHIVATYERDGDNHVLKMYVNGSLEATNDFSSPDEAMARSQGDLFIGQSAVGDGSNLFFGSLDEVKIYNRALLADEVRNNFQTGWSCVVGPAAPPIAENIPTSCGNNVVDANEACDRGATNNGRACTATYGQPCSYCSANCQNVIDVQPLQYCGNGIIEQRERCDVLSPSGAIYVSAINTNQTTEPIKDENYNGFKELACSAEPYIPHTLQKGTKTCGDCTVGVVRNCIRCGLDQNGVSVSGGIINVLATSTGIKDPLFTKDLGKDELIEYTNNNQQIDRRTSSSLRLVIGACGPSHSLANLFANLCETTETSSPLIGQLKIGKNTSPEGLKSYTLLNPYEAGGALINSNLACSQGNDPTKKYVMYINRDWTRPLSFPIVASPQAWQYDLVLSPVINNTIRNKDLRVVVSWVGQGEFYGGILNPFVSSTNPEVTAPSYCNLPGTCPALQKRYSTGISYYTTPNSDWNGVWYHGFNSTNGQTKAESFTINTGVMLGNTYAFFVKSPGSPIRQFKNTARLKVELYLPESPYNPGNQEFFGPAHYFSLFPFRFGIPVKTYYFNTAVPSDNPNAKYWHVFNISKPEVVTPVSSTSVIDVNTIFTGPAQFKYTSNLVRDPNFVEDTNNGDGEPPPPPNIPVGGGPFNPPNIPPPPPAVQ